MALVRERVWRWGFSQELKPSPNLSILSMKMESSLWVTENNPDGCKEGKIKSSLLN